MDHHHRGKDHDALLLTEDAMSDWTNCSCRPWISDIPG